MSEIERAPVRLENSSGGSFPVVGTCTIGRAHTNQIVPADTRISRRHALIHAQEQNQCWLVDLGSSNGTLLNGRRISRPTRLHDGDRIDIGASTFTFHQSAVATDTQPKSTTLRTIAEVKSAVCWLLVADIEGSTQLVRRLPPEELSVLTGEWLAECKQLVEECGGTINKFLGDGFFAYWHSRERTALQIVRAIEALKRLQSVAVMPFRFVLHHGEVVFGGALLGEESLSGADVNFVFRMEKLAAKCATSRLLSDAAQEQLREHLTTNDAGSHELAGFEGQFRFFSF